MLWTFLSYIVVGLVRVYFPFKRRCLYNTWWSSFISLKSWHACFNPEFEVASKTSIWVKLIGLSLELWLETILGEIRNLFGKKIMIYTSFKTNIPQKIGHLLVEIDISEWLVESMDIVVGHKVHIHILDQKMCYLGVHNVTYMDTLLLVAHCLVLDEFRGRRVRVRITWELQKERENVGKRKGKWLEGLNCH